MYLREKCRRPATAYPRTARVRSGFRFYVPHIGRWPSRDPVDDNDEPSLYGFVQNSTIDAVDAYGTQVSGPRQITIRDYPCDCCCADTSFRLGSVRDRNHDAPPLNPAVAMGHFFRVSITYNWVEIAEEKRPEYGRVSRGDCKMEWWEWSTKKIPTTGLMPRRWKQINTTWQQRVPQQDRPCGWPESPATTDRTLYEIKSLKETRDLYIAVLVKSNYQCWARGKCVRRAQVLRLHEHLEVIGGKADYGKSQVQRLRRFSYDGTAGPSDDPKEWDIIGP